MKVVTSIPKMQEISLQTRSAGLELAFVPTMGFLHEGHLELVRRARRIADVVVVSIFVNPMQFDDNNDLAAYPRDEDRDAHLLRQEGVDILFMPSADDVYPADASTSVAVAGLTEGLCGAQRPGHFCGVSTVVSALFNMVSPDVAVFGEKDYQQLQTIRRMTRDLHFPVEILGVPTVREADGLALSSRNVRLTPAQRVSAPMLWKALQAAAGAFQAGENDAEKLLGYASETLSACADIEVEYLELLDSRTLEPVARADRNTVIAIAARIGEVRLIDNIVFSNLSSATSDTVSNGSYRQAKGVRANA